MADSETSTSLSNVTRRTLLTGTMTAALAAAPHAPPSPAEFGLDADTLGALVDLGEVVRVGEGVVYTPEAFAAIEREVSRRKEERT